MATFTKESSIKTVSFPSHFNISMFTMTAVNYFDHEETTLSGIGGSHDTLVVLFQDDGVQTQA